MFKLKFKPFNMINVFTCPELNLNDYPTIEKTGLAKINIKNKSFIGDSSNIYKDNHSRIVINKNNRKYYLLNNINNNSLSKLKVTVLNDSTKENGIFTSDTHIYSIENLDYGDYDLNINIHYVEDMAEDNMTLNIPINYSLNKFNDFDITNLDDVKFNVQFTNCIITTNFSNVWFDKDGNLKVTMIPDLTLKAILYINGEEMDTYSNTIGGSTQYSLNNEFTVNFNATLS